MPEENSKAQSKFSFSVSKKILKKAHDRNKYRRWGYSIVGKHIERVKAGYFCFFSFKKGQYPATFLQIEKEVAELLSGSAVLS